MQFYETHGALITKQIKCGIREPFYLMEREETLNEILSEISNTLLRYPKVSLLLVK